MKKSVPLICLALGACAAALHPPQRASAQALTVTPRNSRLLPGSTTDQNGASFNLAGLSGITHVGGGNFWAVMDNSNKLVQINVAFDNDGDTTAATLAGGLTIADTSDFEGIGFTNAARNSVFLSEETTPGVREYSLATGALLQTPSVPAVFANRRAGFGFESLSYRASGTDLWTGNEEALSVDGPLSTPSAGTSVRLLHYSVLGNSATPDAQYVYQTEPIHGPTGTGTRSGLSDLVVLPDGRVLALERSLASSFTPYQSRIYELDFAGATDVSSLPGLIGQTYTQVSKRLLWSGQAAGGFGQNLEGLALGPQLANGNWSLLGIVDDGDPLSNNTLVAFELSGANIPEPAAIGITLPLTGWWFAKMWRRR